MELLTPNGLAGVAVVRVAAAERASVAALLQDADGRLLSLRPGIPQRALLHLDEHALDDVLVVDRGEQGLELHLHGSPAVLAALQRRFTLAAARRGAPAAELLRRAISVAQLDLALEQLDCDFAACCEEIVRLPAGERAAARTAALHRSRGALALAWPQRVVLVGRQNAGKSTLFNRLLGRERALTGPLAGLTRDPVVECTTLAGYPYELVDTAGEGPTVLAIDAAAVARGRAERGHALVVLVVDAACGPTPLDLDLLLQSDLVVATKVDLGCAPWPASVPRHLEVSALARDAATLREQFGALLCRRRGLPPAGAAGGFAALDAAQLGRLEALPT